MKRCPRCEQTLQASEFHRSAKARDGRHTYCRACSLAYNRSRSTPERRAKNSFDRTMKRRGVTAEWHAERLAACGGVCEVCGDNNGGRTLAIDHNHSNDRIRGLLCDRCNVALGMALDSPERLRSLADYLESHA